MYQRGEETRIAQSRHEATPGPTPEAAARLALARVRKLLGAYAPGLPCDAGRLSAALGTPFADASLEVDRLFALGWLGWLEGNPAAAEPVLAEVVRRAREAGAVAGVPPAPQPERLAEAAYWCARVRLRLGRADAVGEYEAVLRTLGGSPQATAWFVDLLWRAGRVDRAEQVWKSLRGNRRVAGCPEGPLLEARVLLRRGEIAPAERALNESRPVNGVVWVERLLLLAWAAFTAKQPERGRALLAQAREGPYPRGALDAWEDLCLRRADGEGMEGVEANAPAALRDFLRGQEARLAGDRETAAAAYRAALEMPAVQPFARYALACLGQEDPAAVLAAQPGLFLAVRCRARAAGERFRRRQITPADYLDALGPATAVGYSDAGAEHCRRLAQALGQKQVDGGALRELAAGGGDGLRAAIELAVRRLPPQEALQLLREWSEETELGPVIGRQMLRLLLLDTASGGRQPPVLAPPVLAPPVLAPPVLVPPVLVPPVLAPPVLAPPVLAPQQGADAPRSPEEALAVAQRLLPGDPLLALAGGERHSAAENAFIQLLELAERLAQDPAEVGEPWRQEVRRLRGRDRLKSLAQALLLQEAAARRDAAAVAALLDEADYWRRFSSAPPRFILQALANVAAAPPAHPAWRRSLGRWLGLWDAAALGPAGAALAAQAGIAPARGAGTEPPPGVPARPWLLHQASKALGRDDPTEALACVRQALDRAPELASSDNATAEARLVCEALPELERRAGAQALAAVLHEGPEGAMPPGLLAGAVDLLAALPQGQALLDSAVAGDAVRAREALAALAESPDLPPPLAHHLALLQQRIARDLEDLGQVEQAEPHWRRAWRCWLRFLAEPPAPEARDLVLDRLLTIHRHRLNDLLAREAIASARGLWRMVQDLPALAPEALREETAARVERFGDELATEYLLTTREAMRHGDVPEGWRADYEKGLAGLRRFLSLDRDNVRLLTALVEVHADWLLDLFRLGEGAAMREQVDRCMPFALHLGRLVEGRPGDLAARAALSEFCTFRGLLSRDRDQKKALYHEALRFNPANPNVRNLLLELEPPPDPAPEE
jgi:tetratricopeptide (TPR) repeat protein